MNKTFTKHAKNMQKICRNMQNIQNKYAKKYAQHAQYMKKCSKNMQKYA